MSLRIPPQLSKVSGKATSGAEPKAASSSDASKPVVAARSGVIAAQADRLFLAGEGPSGAFERTRNDEIGSKNELPPGFNDGMGMDQFLPDRPNPAGDRFGDLLSSADPGRSAPGKGGASATDLLGGNIDPFHPGSGVPGMSTGRDALTADLLSPGDPTARREVPGPDNNAPRPGDRRDLNQEREAAGDLLRGQINKYADDAPNSDGAGGTGGGSDDKSLKEKAGEAVVKAADVAVEIATDIGEGVAKGIGAVVDFVWSALTAPAEATKIVNDDQAIVNGVKALTQDPDKRPGMPKPNEYEYTADDGSSGGYSGGGSGSNTPATPPGGGKSGISDPGSQQQADENSRLAGIKARGSLVDPRTVHQVTGDGRGDTGVTYTGGADSGELPESPYGPDGGLSDPGNPNLPT